jgi:hypothetical protein
MKLFSFAFIVAVFGGAMVGQTTATLDAPTIPTLTDVDPEILQLVIQDQWDRGVDMFGGRVVRTPDSLDGNRMSARDEERRAALGKLLEAGRVKTARDNWYSALIFQHGTKSQDFLLAHMLASTAVAKGETKAKWLAASTLDRYLWILKQPQVFGTQFTKKTREDPWTMEPFDRSALSDAIRAIWCVVPIAEQEHILKDSQDGKPLRSTSDPQCR